MMTIARYGIFGLLVVLVGLFFALLPLVAILAWIDGFDSPVTPFAGPLILIDVVLVWLILRAQFDKSRRDARLGMWWSDAARLHRFAKANGLHYLPEVRDPVRIGTIFTAGTRRLVRDLISNHDGVPFELGNYQYAGRAHERSLCRFGFVHMRMPRRLPHMILISKRRWGLFRRSTLPWSIDRRQVLRLGAPFDNHFTLYCPAEYAEDARYVFTPKLMTVLMSKATSFDLEIIEDRLLLYRGKPLVMTSPETYELLGELIGSVGALTSARAVLYSDPRAFQPREIAPGGRRLRVHRPLLAKVLTALVILYVVARVITAVLGIGM